MSDPPFMTLRTRRPANDERSMSSADSAYGSATEGSSPATHDISRVSYHVKHIESFAQALQDSASRAFPNQGQAAQRYSKVHALMLHWKSDDLFVLPELEDLEKCLREHYNFGTDIFSIPSENSHLDLMLKIGDMVKQYESDDTLFVVYYGGHARIDEARQSTWCANRRPGSPWLQWSAIQTLLERSVSDVLILLDCCAGAASATFPTGKSITETISASSWDAIAPDPGRYSFTNALIEVLDEWRQRTFSAAMLHAEILARLKHPRPILINGKHFEARSTPVHFMMTSNHRAPSIEFCRLVPRTRLPPSPPNELSYWDRPSLPRMIEGRNPAQAHPSFAPDFSIPAASDPNEDEPHVLISLALEDDQRLDLNDWETWLAAFPAIAKFVKVQGVFKSHSTLLLLSLPVMVWDFLPDDPACSFVSFIRSNNLLRAQKSSPEPAAQVPVTSEAQVFNSIRDDAESYLSGTTYGPTESLDFTSRPVNTTRNLSAIPTPYRDSLAELRLPPRMATSVGGRPEHTSLDFFPPSGPSAGPRPQASLSSMRDSLRNVPSIASLRTLDRRQLSPLSPVASNDLPTPTEGISRTMIINRARSSKKSVFSSDQHVPQGQQMAPHVVRRLEDYFQKDAEPSVGVVEHLASNLGVWFHHRREQEQMTQNLQGLRVHGHHRQPQNGPRMILPGHLNRLLEIYPSKGILLVDLRLSTDFERSHIHDAINLRAPLSFVENTSLEMIEDTFMDDQSRRSFSKWSQWKCVVFYDRVIEFQWECPVADSLYAKFRRKGWQGQCFILKGHYREFSASFDKYITGFKMTSEAKEYVDSLRQQSSPTEEEAADRDEAYHFWLDAFASQHHVPIVDLIPARKLERQRAVEQHQKELEIEFEARFPALYKKSQAMRPAPTTRDEFPSTPMLPSSTISQRPEPRPLLQRQSAPVVVSHLHSQVYHDEYPEKAARREYYSAAAVPAVPVADESETDYDEIDPKSEGKREEEAKDLGVEERWGK
ncbi:hypothetical protein N0V88_001652 [Collariella sp. IMI 366227]|nr:hypothetical protein N0V88_001652 [Collariella sp. IMI 366227]